MEKIVIEKINEKEYINFLAAPESIYKNFIYNRDIKGTCFTSADVLKDGNKITYSYADFKIKRSKNSYYKRIISKSGFTLDEKGKLKIWFGASIEKIPFLYKLLHILEYDWFESCLNEILTKGGLEKILTNKITNPIDFCKNYLKVCHIKASPVLLYKALKEASVKKFELHLAVNSVRNFDHFLQWYTNIKNNDKIEGFNEINNKSQMFDLIQQAIILNDKINCKWSAKRMTEVHKKWTRKLMDIEVENMSDDKIEGLDDLKMILPPTITLLDSRRKVFEEGRIMYHCIYTNYWSAIKNKQYLVFHINYNEEVATLMVKIGSDGFDFIQVSSICNSKISNCLSMYIKEWIDVSNQMYSGIIKSIVPEVLYEKVYERF